MTLFDSTREWVAVRACELRPGDAIVRRQRRGPVVQSVARDRLPGWLYVAYDGGRGGQNMRANTPLVVERRVGVPA